MKGERERAAQRAVSQAGRNNYKFHRGGSGLSQLEKVVGLTGFVIIHVFIASFSPAQGERNQMVNTKFTRPVNEMPMSSF